MGTARRGKYGIDAPYVPLLLGVVGLLNFLPSVADVATGLEPGASTVVAVLQLLLGLVLVSSAGLYLYATLRGKFAVWSDLLDGFALRGDERVLDMGCGRGAVLLLAAQRLTTGRAVGVDLWRSVDQSGNSVDATTANAAVEGVVDRVELHTGDMTSLPFGDGEFDVVVSSLAIHNISDVAARAVAVREAVRVLRPGGRLALADFRHVRDYERSLADAGVTGLTRRGLGWRFWYGGPWAGTDLVTGTRPT